MEKEKYVLGLDIGISSVGWALLKLNEDNKPIKIKDLGVKIFSPGEVVKTGESKNFDRRNKRLSRRIIRRKEFRLNRVRLLLSEYEFLEKSNKKLLSKIFNELKNNYSKLIDNYYQGKDINPYVLRYEGLNRKLTSDELSIILVHYAKNRGYKSNREDSTEDDSGKVKAAIKLNENLMKEKKYKTISEMFSIDEKFNDRIHNTTGDYRMSINRELVLDDINKVLDKQISLGTITKEFKNDYIGIWGSQRHYSKGPGFYYEYEDGKRVKKESPYGGNLIEKMTGKCKFTNLPRAPKQAPSSEIYIGLIKLVNLRYRNSQNTKYSSLNKENINQIMEIAYTKESITYKDISKVLGISDIIFKDLSLDKKEFTKALDKFKKDVLKRDDKERIDFGELSEEDNSKFNKIKNDILLAKVLFSLKTYKLFKNNFSKAFGNDKWEEIKYDFVMFDEISVILTNYKTDEDIRAAIEKNNLIDNIYTDLIINDFKTFKDHMYISLELIRDLIPLLKEGMLYNEAMEELGYNFSDLNENEEKYDLLIPINYKKEIKNQRVIRSLSQTRKLINSIIKKYGMPYKINVETARELAKEMDERREIKRKQEENKIKNEEYKKVLVDLLPSTFKSIDKVSSQDILKYRLWLEQNELCAYSLERIALDELFDNNVIQIDHILPYSRTFDDGYNNKTLVRAKYNQEKGNMTPYEWMKNTNKWDEFKTYINSLQISNNKKDNYLLMNLTAEIENDYRSQNLNDTKYISKYITSFLKAHLNIPVVDNVNGVITGKLRARWGLNNLTHSIESPTYYLKDVDENNDTKKNRENHLHHAMDACVIACSNPSLIQNVTKYEKFKKYFDNKTENQINNVLESNNISRNEDIHSYVDNETGEIIEDASLDEFFKDVKNGRFILKKKDNLMHLQFPTPYPDFINELKYRVFERDKEKLEFNLKGLSSYNDNEVKDIYPIIPVQSKEKISGALHKETFSGLKEREGIKYSTSRMSVNSTSFSLKKLEQLCDKDGGSKEVYETLRLWLGKHTHGEEAFKSNGFPKDKTGKLIKKVKLETVYEGKGHIIKGKLADKTSILRIEVFQDKETNKLLFAGLDYNDIISLRKDKNYEITSWQGTSIPKKISYILAENEYIHCPTLYKNDLILLEKNNGKKSVCYVNGFTDGKIDINSPLGDFYDIVLDDKLFSIFYSAGQYPLSVATIKSIKLLKINTLGKIENGL